MISTNRSKRGDAAGIIACVRSDYTWTENGKVKEQAGTPRYCPAHPLGAAPQEAASRTANICRSVGHLEVL